MPQAPLPLRAAVLWGLLAGAIAAAFAVATFPQIPPASDLWDYAQEARQLARGEGFTSLYTYPVHLGRDEPPFPVRWRMPLFSAIGAGLLRLGVPLPAGYFLVGVLAHAALVALVFLLAATLHSPRAGSIAAAASIASPLLLDPYGPALSQVPTAALAMGVWLLLARGQGLASSATASVVAAAAWYLRGESVLMTPVWLWAAARWRSGAGGPRSTGRRRAAVFGLTYAALCVPWLVAARTMHGGNPIQGNPMLLYTAEYPGYSSSRAYGVPLPGVLEYALGHPLELVVRFLKDMAGYAVDLLWGIGPVAIGLAMAGLLLREPRARWGSLKEAGPLLVAAAIQITAFSVLERSPRFLVPAVPLVCVAIGVAAAPTLDRICGRRNVVALFALLILERGLTLGFETREAARRFPPMPPRVAVALAEGLRGAPPGIVWSDVPDWVAWQVDRPALLLPLWDQRTRVAADHPAAAVFLSPGALRRNLADGDEGWIQVIDRWQPITGFQGPMSLSADSRLYVARR